MPVKSEHFLALTHKTIAIKEQSWGLYTVFLVTE